MALCRHQSGSSNSRRDSRDLLRLAGRGRARDDPGCRAGDAWRRFRSWMERLQIDADDELRGRVGCGRRVGGCQSRHLLHCHLDRRRCIRWSRLGHMNCLAGNVDLLLPGDRWQRSPVTGAHTCSPEPARSRPDSPSGTLNSEIAAAPYVFVARKLAHRTREANMPFLDDIGAVTDGSGKNAGSARTSACAHWPATATAMSASPLPASPSATTRTRAPVNSAT